MKYTFVCLFLLFSSTPTMGQRQDNCECTKGLKRIYTLEKNNQKVIICGLNIEEIDDNSIQITSLTIIDCQKNQVLIDKSLDEIFPYRITSYDDSIVISDQHFVPIGDNWEMTSIPLTEKTLSVNNESIQLSNERMVFKYPELNTIQVDSINSICKTLEPSLNDKGQHYPLGYETLYILFVGAYKNIGNSRFIFEQLRNKFVFDGAVAETLGEIHYELLIKD